MKSKRSKASRARARTKRDIKRAKPADLPVSDATPLDPEAVLLGNMRQLQSLLGDIESGATGSIDVVKDTARLSVALATTCAELRQIGKQEKRELAKFPLETVIEYIKTLPLEQREDIARDITDANADQGLL